MPSTRALSPAKAILRSLADKFNELDSLANDPGDPRFNAALDQAGKLWEQLRNVLNKSQTRTITEFFDAIGSSIVEAQERLDEASETYVRSAIQRESAASGLAVAGRGSSAPSEVAPALGTLFRIPRVTAELKCSLEMDREKGFNVIFYTDRTDVRELHQQTVHLEVVAVPAPPDYINYLKSHPEPQPSAAVSATTGSEPIEFSEPDSGDESAQGPMPLSDSADDSLEPAGPVAAPQHPRISEPRPDLPSIETYLRNRVSDHAERAELRALIEKLDKRQRRTRESRRSSIRKLLLPAWPQALVLTDRGNTRFILLATTDTRPRLLIWQLVRRPTALRLLFQLPKQKKVQRALSDAHRFLAELGALQAALVRS